ncbi:four helix bundle protein [Winogradskyella pacifica]|uniref:Four helix bundle protein n=1 Tax=Winogradskyella pacifica TaxID=664642 RepID=A0A3D9N7I5_9FLAO|nr:four helix bundle protein [Winogradskyella pacifica]
MNNDFPSDEKFGFTSQLSRCSVSIPSNIAEDLSRTNKSFSYFIDIALGSSFELERQLIIAFKKKLYNTINKNRKKLEEFQKMTMGFQNKLYESLLFFLMSRF